MRTLSRLGRYVLAAIALLYGWPAMSRDKVTEPPIGQIVIDFSKLKPEFPGKRGVFRDPTDKPNEQFVQERLVVEKLPGEGQSLGCLQLAYVVVGQGTYNGYWFEYDQGKGNWEKFKGGAMILRLKMGGKCTPIFKLELKTADPESEKGLPNTFSCTVSLVGLEKMMQENGYADVVVPFKQFKDVAPKFDTTTLQVMERTPYLRDVRQIVVVFEQTAIPEEFQKGVLLISSIRLIDGPEKAEKEVHK